jgi:hypothetical protein
VPKTLRGPEVYRVLTSSVCPAGSSVEGDRVAAVTGVT